jgi:hypothetical protein
MTMLADDDLYLDRAELAARGWTKTLIERYLPNPDRSVSGQPLETLPQARPRTSSKR